MMLMHHHQQMHHAAACQCTATGVARQRGLVVRAAPAASGFGKSNKKPVVMDAGGMVVPKKLKNVSTRDLADDGAAAADKRSSSVGDGPPGFPKDWIDLKIKAADFPLGKTAKPVELVGGRTLMVYKFDGKVFASDANSTAYQYPMTDARLFKSPDTGRVAAEVPLDGTVYDLSTGAVLTWCPKDNPVRGLLGALKSKADPSPLKVYPVTVTADGSIWTKLA